LNCFNSLAGFSHKKAQKAQKMNRAYLSFLCLFVALLTAGATFGGGPVGPEANDRARQILDRSLNALGGSDRLKALASITMKGTGKEHPSAQAQGYEYGKRTDQDYNETLVAFPAQGKFAFEHRTDEGDRKIRWRRWLYDGNQRLVGDFLVQGTYTSRSESNVRQRSQQMRRIPHLLLLEASEDPSSLRFISDSTSYRGRQHSVLAYTPLNESVTLNLFLDNQTQLLSKLEYQIDFPALGDTRLEYTYSEYRRDQYLGWAPSRHTINVAGNVALEVDVVMSANLSNAEEIFNLPKFPVAHTGETFQLPPHMKALAGTPGSIVEAANGVNLLELNGFTVMFIEFKDFILVAEAPAAHPSIVNIPANLQQGSTELSEAFIQKIKAKLPGKPIKYLVVTHYHSDHSGGARAFMAEGATILTTSCNKSFFEKMSSASYRLKPDRLSRNPRPVKIETFQQKRTLSDGVRTVELINVGRNPHSNDNLVVYIPAEKILFQGDLFYFDIGDEFPPKNRITIMSFFAKWLRNNNLAPERIYSVHSHGFATPEHINRLLN
jgi:glyoxylase-like metal-dependent hydrolase (beta-lactamase superfamily II)